MQSIEYKENVHLNQFPGRSEAHGVLLRSGELLLLVLALQVISCCGQATSQTVATNPKVLVAIKASNIAAKHHCCKAGTPLLPSKHQHYLHNVVLT